jgi:hypothetical protein
MTTIYRKKHKAGEPMALRPGNYEVEVDASGDGWTEPATFTIKPLDPLPRPEKQNVKKQNCSMCPLHSRAWCFARRLERLIRNLLCEVFGTKFWMDKDW